MDVWFSKHWNKIFQFVEAYNGHQTQLPDHFRVVHVTLKVLLGRSLGWDGPSCLMWEASRTVGKGSACGIPPPAFIEAFIRVLCACLALVTGWYTETRQVCNIYF